MNKKQFEYFDKFRKELKEYCEILNSEYSEILKPLQKEASKKDTPDYPIETPVVYNTALDELTEDSQINLIVIGDNPGKNEQLEINKKYLVGQSGKIAANFFARNPEFKTDFRKNAIILNKTPIHTAKTKHLKELQKTESIKKIIEESQIFMAQKTAELHKNLLSASETNTTLCELWLVGYAELKGRGLFLKYRDELKNAYKDSNGNLSPDWEKVLVFQHFSMNCFSGDLKKYREANPTLSIVDSIHNLGKSHKEEIF